MGVAAAGPCVPTRRRLLATLGAAAGAGCLGPAGGSGPTEQPPRESSPDGSPTDYTHTGEPRGSDGCTAGFDVVAEPVDPADDLTIRLGDRARSLLAEADARGAAEATLYADSPPVDDGVFVEHDGAFYETTVRRVDNTDVPAVVTNLEWERGQRAPDDAAVVAYADLPAADRAALRYGVYGGPYEREQRGHPTESLTLREVPLPYPQGTDESALAGDGETWVRWDGRTYGVWTEGETTTRHRFRLTVTEVAGTAEAFRAFVVEAYLLELSGLAEPERAILRAAVEDRYDECTPASEGLAALRDRLPEDARFPPPQYDAWYVAFEGDRYALSIVRWVH